MFAWIDRNLLSISSHNFNSLTVFLSKAFRDSVLKMISVSPLYAFLSRPRILPPVSSKARMALDIKNTRAQEASSPHSLGLSSVVTPVSFSFLPPLSFYVFQRGVGQSFLSFLVAVALASNIAPPSSLDYYENIPQTLSGEEKVRRIQRPNSPKAESCTRKCVSTCIRGGAGGPGEGPLNVRRPLVVFKEGFRSRQYCLVECSDICNLIGDGDDGP